MENVNSEQTTPQTQPVITEEKAEGVNDGIVSLGKFKDVNALLSAYSSLQAEFTKRCQKIKELESALDGSDKALPPIPEQVEKLDDAKENISEQEKQDVLIKYLQGVVERKQKAVLLDGAGVGVKLPVIRPKTIAQASVLAKEFLDK